MPPKRQALWNELQGKMGAKRARAEAGKRGKNATAPHELSWLFNGWQRNETTNKHLDTFLMVRPLINLYHRKNL